MFNHACREESIIVADSNKSTASRVTRPLHPPGSLSSTLFAAGPDPRLAQVRPSCGLSRCKPGHMGKGKCAHLLFFFSPSVCSGTSGLAWLRRQISAVASGAQPRTRSLARSRERHARLTVELAECARASFRCEGAGAEALTNPGKRGAWEVVLVTDCPRRAGLSGAHRKRLCRWLCWQVHPLDRRSRIRTRCKRMKKFWIVVALHLLHCALGKQLPLQCISPLHGDSQVDC